MQFIRTKTFKISAIVLVLVGLYALAGFVLAPKLLRNALLEDIPEALPGVKPTIGDIHVNPFLFQLELKDFALTGAGGEKLVGFGRFFIDFELSSIWHRAYSFANIDVTSPYANAVMSQDGRLNLLQLSPKPAAPAAPEKKSEPIPSIRIGSFKVSQGLLTYDDRSHPSDFAARLEPINFELKEFTTGVDGGRFTFTGSSKLGERVEWHGHVSVQPIESDGEFQIDGLQVHTIWDYLEDRLNFVVNSGKIDLNATYKFSLKDAVDLKVDVSKVAISDLTVRQKDADTDWVTLPSLVVSGTTVDLAPRQATVDSVVVTGLKLVTWLEPDGTINLMKLAAAPAPKTAVPDASTPAPAPATPTAAAPAAGAAAATAPAAPPAPAAPAAAAPAAPWSLALREFALNDANIAAEDRSVKPAAKVVLAPLNVKVDGISLDLSKPVKVAVDVKINENGSLKATGDVTPQPVAANLNLKLDGIELAVAQPYIAQFTSMTLMAGSLSGDTQLHYGAGKPALQFSGGLSVAKLHTVDNALHDDFINWERLDVQGLNYQHDPDRLDIDLVTVRKAYARVIIEPDSSINVKRVLAGPGATLTAPGAAGTTAAPVTATAAAPPVAPTRGKKAAGGKASPTGKPADALPGPSGPPPMPMNIRKILVESTEANFADLSVMPNFQTGIQKLHGSVLGLSSKPNSRAKIDLHGSIDEFAPVAITGEVNALSNKLFTDLVMSFQNIELSTFNPYSGKFAGYNIAKGKLSTELHYKIDGRKLDAQHHITVDQLEFGDKTESKDAVSLPIKLAVALIKDRNGVIDLDLPVTGSLDDPQFKIGPIIWKVFVNILEKAVTAPFALLGSLFGGGPDLQFIDFEPGLAALDEAAIAKTKTLVKALNERPQLKMEVPIAVVNDLDRPTLLEVQFQNQLRELQADGGGRKKGGAAPAFDQLDPGAKLDLLEHLYKKVFGSEPKFPDSVTSVKAKPDLLAAKTDFLSSELHHHIIVSESDLTALGQQRAQNLQAALLTDSQIDPARVFLVANDKAKNQDGKVRLELSLR